MNKDIRNFIEDFIRDNAKKDIEFGYDLTINHDLNKNQQTELINNLISLDPKNVREVILDYAQSLIDERMQIVLTQDRYELGCIKRVDPVNGEISIPNRRGF